jgi:hypothetical protein
MTKTIAHKYNCQVISISNPIIINCIIGNKKTIHVCVLCRIIGGINTSHTALPAFDKCLCMPKDVSIHSRMCDEAKSMHLLLLIKQHCSDSTKSMQAHQEISSMGTRPKALCWHPTVHGLRSTEPGASKRVSHGRLETEAAAHPDASNK